MDDISSPKSRPMPDEYGVQALGERRFDAEL